MAVDNLYLGQYKFYDFEVWIRGDRVEIPSPIEEAKEKGLIQQWDDSEAFVVDVDAN